MIGLKREATCSCGDLRAICTGEPDLVSACHCVACQKRTGTPFGIAAFFARGHVETSGASEIYDRSSDTGHRVVFHFCARCGSTVFWEPARKPDMIAVAVGAFGDAGFPAPSKEAFTECRHDWLRPITSGS